MLFSATNKLRSETVALLLLLLLPMSLTCGCASMPGVPWFLASSPLARKTKADQAVQHSLISARSLERSGKLDQAIAAYEKVLGRAPDNAVAFHRLAVLLDQKGNFSDSEEYFQKALRLASEDPEVYCDYGYCQYLRENYEAAEQAIRDALERAPEMNRAHINLGLVAARTGRLDEAFRQFQQGGCSPESAHVNVAHVLMWAENWDQAQQAVEYALEANPASPEAAQAMSRIVRMRSQQPGKLPGQLPSEMANAQPSYLDTVIERPNELVGQSPNDVANVTPAREPPNELARKQPSEVEEPRSEPQVVVRHASFQP